MNIINKIIFLVLISILLICSGCDKPNNQDPNTPKEKQDIMEPTTDMKVVEDYLLNKISHNILNEDIILPTTYNNIKITWESLSPDTIDNEGKLITHPNKITEVTYNYCLEDDNNKYYNETIFKIYNRTFQAIANQFEQQFTTNISEDYEVNTIFDKYYHVDWTSSNPDCFTNQGKYIKPAEDTEITINYKVYVDELTFKEFSCQAVVSCMSDVERVKASIEWLNNKKIVDLDLKTNIEFPTTSELGSSISWNIYNSMDIIDEDGTIHPTVYDRYVQVYTTVSSQTYKESLTYLFKICAKDISKMSEKEILEEFLDTIGVKNIKEVEFKRYQRISATSSNFIDFFDNVYEERIEALAPSPASNVPGKKQTEIKFVCVHDTANNNAGAKAHADYVEQGGGGTSFQYVVGNDGIYHLVENGYVAYHAGDGTSQSYQLIDTGVKASDLNNATHPIQGISEDEYFTLNGIKTTIHIPSGSTAFSKICTTGIYMEILPNGNYGMNVCYFNTTYSCIANRGGNNNSVGIETCVNQYTDYFKTIRYNIDLVSWLCTTYNLSVDQVLQHNSFSGKPCPDAIRWANYWQSFRDYVSMEKFGMEHFKGLTFKWTPQSDGINKYGYIQKDISNLSSVSYSVEVYQGDNLYVSKSYTTQIIK